jgi:glycosyltransferase involved in cell wall biosynthesis
MFKEMGISVILPAYNEEKNIEKTIARTLEALRSQFERFEIIIIDDASKDETGKMADALAAEHPEISVIRNEKNLGQGACQIKGFRKAKYELVTHNGMDYPFDFNDLSKMLPLFDKADVVVAERTGRPGYTLFRKFISFANLTLMNLLFPLHLRDYNFIQVYRKKVLDSISVDAGSAGFVIPETLIRAHDLGFRIQGIPIEYHAREAGEAKCGSFRVIYNSTRELLRFWWKRLRGRGIVAKPGTKTP